RIIPLEALGEGQPVDGVAAPDPLGGDATLAAALAVPASLSEVGGFRVVREIGRGGMGVVYEAEQPPLGRRVALKILPPAASLDPRHRQRFEIEAQAAALLHHENIVSIFGFGTDRGVDYFAMPLIEGWSLSDVIRDRRSQPSRSGSETPCTVAPCLPAGGRSYVLAVARLMLQAADALDHAHSVGVIHRDIKPSNLLVDARGKLWVADFGLARIGRGEPALTGTGDLLGTLRYMSPELLRGDRDVASPRSDLYALGATLYELLTLRPAFAVENREELYRRILHDEPPAPRGLNPSIPRDLETIVQKAMAKEPSARYATAGELADDLRRFLDDRPVVARRPGPLGLAVRWARRRRAVVVPAALILMVVLSVSTVLLWTAKRRTEAALQLQKQALTRQVLAYHLSLATVDRIARAIGPDPSHPDLKMAEEAIQLSAGFFDRIASNFANDSSMQEVVANAHRSAGNLRLIQGRSSGRKNFEQSIALFKRIAAEHPDRVWLRTRLIETLTEYSGFLDAAGETRAADTALQQAASVAEGVVDDPQAQAHCFTMALTPAVCDLAWALIRHPTATPADTARAVVFSRTATRWEPRSSIGWSALSAAHYRAGDWEGTAQALDRALAADGGSLSDQFLLAALDHHRGKSSLACDRFLEASKHLRENPRDRCAASLAVEVGQLLGIAVPGSENDAPPSAQHPG
ncbi:MAG: serine/threonine-protein kinase, partial [Isosphaeraceae bacterium]